MLLYKPTTLQRAACRLNIATLIGREPLVTDDLKLPSNATGVLIGRFDEHSARKGAHG